MDVPEWTTFEGSRAVSPDVTAADALAAEQAALAAEEAAEGLDVRAATEDVSQQEADAIRHTGWLARHRADRVAADAVKAEARRRLDALAEHGRWITDYASGADEAMHADVARLAGLADSIRQRAAEHDGQVRARLTAIQALGAEPLSPLGPKSTSAYVCGHGTPTGPRAGVQRGQTVVRAIGESLEEAIVIAVTGGLDRATEMLRSARQAPEPRRQDHYFWAGGGHVVAHDDPLPGSFQRQIRDGTLVPLSPSDVTRYLNGELA